MPKKNVKKEIDDVVTTEDITNAAEKLTADATIDEGVAPTDATSEGLSIDSMLSRIASLEDELLKLKTSSIQLHPPFSESSMEEYHNRLVTLEKIVESIIVDPSKAKKDPTPSYVTRDSHETFLAFMRRTGLRIDQVGDPKNLEEFHPTEQESEAIENELQRSRVISDSFDVPQNEIPAHIAALIRKYGINTQDFRDKGKLRGIVVDGLSGLVETFTMNKETSKLEELQASMASDINQLIAYHQYLITKKK